MSIEIWKLVVQSFLSLFVGMGAVYFTIGSFTRGKPILFCLGWGLAGIVSLMTFVLRVRLVIKIMREKKQSGNR
jgi:hypothetical protein